MSNILIPAGSPNALFFAVAASGSSVFQKIKAKATGGISIEENFPRTFVVSANQTEQSGLYTVTVSMSFIGEYDTVWKIARGIDLSLSVNSPPANTVYSLFILNNNKTQPKSFYFPSLSVFQPLRDNQDNDKATIVPIVLTGTSRDPSNLMFKDKFPNLLTDHSLSGRVPIFGY